MDKKLNIFVSVILITDEYTGNASKRVDETIRILKSSYENYEAIVVDNGLGKKQLEAVSNLLHDVACIRVIRLAKKADIDTAIFAGVESSIGDFVSIAYNQDPIRLIPSLVEKNQKHDIVFGLAKNLRRKNVIESLGARIFYWYSRKYLDIDIPVNSTFFMSLNRNAANALTKSGGYVRHIRQLASQVGFSPTSLNYSLPDSAVPYSHTPNTKLVSKAVGILVNYSSHPLRVASYFGILASALNIIYALYVVVVNIAQNNVEKGWTTLSLQSSLMFFVLFLIMAILCEYVGKILVESRREPPYHIMQELSSTISIADEHRRNVTK